MDYLLYCLRIYAVGRLSVFVEMVISKTFCKDLFSSFSNRLLLTGENIKVSLCWLGRLRPSKRRGPVTRDAAFPLVVGNPLSMRICFK